MQKRIPLKLPILNILNGVMRGLAVAAISGYQKFISPRKGFSCAHRVLYGCESCSQYFKQVVAEEGIITAIANAKGRFQECREANEILKKRRAKCRTRQKYYASRVSNYMSNHTLAIESGGLENSDIPENPEDAENPNKKSMGGSQWGRKTRSQATNNGDSGANNNCNDCADCGDGISAMDCNNLNCPELSCPDLNCANADCLSGMDCSGLDCGGLDCSGCGDCGSCG